MIKLNLKTHKNEDDFACIDMLFKPCPEGTVQFIYGVKIIMKINELEVEKCRKIY